MAHDPLPVLVHQASETPTTVIAVLHGHGDDPARLLERVAGLVPADVGLLAPIGPVRTADGGAAWFVSADGDAPERPGDFGTLAEAVERLTATFVAGTNDTEPSRVIGYSQGAATALALVFGAAPEPRWRPATVATVAGWLASDPDVTWDFAGAAGHTRADLVHGADDDVVDAQLGRSTARVLERSGVAVTFTEVPGGHALSDDEILRLLA